MTTSREKLLEYIQTHRVVTVEDLSRALQMTPANARHHLGILERQGLVQVTGQLPMPGRGRPAQIYSLSENILGHNLDQLVEALLREALGALQEDEKEAFLRRVAMGLVDGKPHPPAPLPETEKGIMVNLTQRLNTAVRRMNEMHYQARWEAHAKAPRLILEHCPYKSILAQHPELCFLDASILEGMLSTHVRQIAKLEHDPRGAVNCIFSVR